MLICFILIGGALVVFPFLNHFLIFAIVCLVCGTVMSPVFIGQDTLIHHYADEFIRGRIFSLRDWVLNGTFALGALLVGFLSTFTEKMYLFIIFGIIVAALAILGWFILARGKNATVSQNHA